MHSCAPSLKKTKCNAYMLKEKIREIARSLQGKAVATRRHLHAHPELSFEETQTAAFVASKLDALGIPYTPMANTGLVALLEGRPPETQQMLLQRVEWEERHVDLDASLDPRRFEVERERLGGT